MEHWQQRAEREDPYPEWTFDDGRKWNPDTLVGLVCLLAAIVGFLA
jgi:hypothetical protein